MEASVELNDPKLKALFDVIEVTSRALDLGLSPDRILTALSDTLALQNARTGPAHSLEEMERSEVLCALERNAWNQTHAARALRITLRQIGYKIRKFGLDAMVAERRARRSSPLAP